LAIGERADCAHVEERPQLQECIAAVVDHHESPLPVELPRITTVNAASGLARSQSMAQQTVFRPRSGDTIPNPRRYRFCRTERPRLRQILLLRGPRGAKKCGVQSQRAA
jgi:hypothetical protein